MERSITGIKSFPGEHEPILTQELFDAVQSIRQSAANARSDSYEKSGALLAGLIFDDRGNRMSPTYVKKGNLQYRYYLSWVLVQGQKA